MSVKFEIVMGDITHESCDAIVNAANESLLGGGGVDGAIHRRAGYELLNECRTLDGCRVGEAKITKGYNLPARHVIHTVGPRWISNIVSMGKTADQMDSELASCYRESLRMADQQGLKSISFPSIATGGFGFPIKRAAKIALETIGNFISNENRNIESIRIICFDSETYDGFLAIAENGDEDIEYTEDMKQSLKQIFDPYGLFPRIK